MGKRVYCSMPSKQYLSSAHPTGGHVTRLEHHRRGRHVLLGADVDQQVQTYWDKVAGGVVNSTIALAAARAIQKAKGAGSHMSLEKSFMQRMGFVMRRLRRRLRSCPQIRRSMIEESYDIFDGGGEQHSS